VPPDRGAAIAATLPAGEPSPVRLRVPLQRAFFATRPAFLSITLIGVLLGITSAWSSGISFNVLNALLTLAFALTAHAGANVINDFHDQSSDAANHERVFPFTGGSRFIQNGVLTAQQTRYLGYGLLSSVIPAGLWLTTQAGPGLLLIGLAGLIIAWAYSAPPLRLAGRGLGEFAITLGRLLVVIGSDFVQRGQFVFLPVAAGTGYALLVASVLYINQFPDMLADDLSGKRTLVVRLGRARARAGYPLLLWLAYGSVIVAAISAVLPAPTLLCLAALPVSLIAMHGLWQHADQPAKLAPAIKLTILAAHLQGTLMILALIAHKVLP